MREQFLSAVSAALPANCLAGHWPDVPLERLTILAIGKAALSMAHAAASNYGTELRGLALVPDGYDQNPGLPEGIRVMHGSHPVPDPRSVAAANAAVDLVQGLAEQDLLLVLLSGGGSSVMCKPREGISLEEKRELIRMLQDAGAPISDINCVRQQLSSIKGGQLARATQARIITLAISDVPGNEPGLISSGPTVDSNKGPGDALDVLARYGIKVDPGICSVLSQTRSAMPDRRNNRAEFSVVTSGNTMLEQAARCLAADGYQVLNHGDVIEGNAADLARQHARQALQLATSGGKHCILSGGETSVRLAHPTGIGGRNTEYLLSLAIHLGEVQNVWALACDSDGIDGNGSHAGAVIGPGTLARATALGLSAADYLEKHDSAGFFNQLGDLVETGPIQTNVSDFRLLLIGY
jgi:glycerate-2-kinase